MIRLASALLLLVTIVCTSLTAEAQYAKVEVPLRHCTILGCTTWGKNVGTATCIGYDNDVPYFLGVGHNWYDMGQWNLNGAVVVIDGRRIPIRLCEAKAGTPDLALFCPTGLAPRIPCVPIAESDATPGMQVQWTGYPGGRLHRSSSTVLNVQTNDVVAARRSHDGDSGAAMLASGQIVGVVWGTDGKSTRGANVVAIRTFMAEVSAKHRINPRCGNQGQPIQPPETPPPLVEPWKVVPPPKQDPPPIPEPAPIDEAKLWQVVTSAVVDAVRPLNERISALESKIGKPLHFQLRDEKGNILRSAQIRIGDTAADEFWVTVGSDGNIVIRK